MLVSGDVSDISSMYHRHELHLRLELFCILLLRVAVAITCPASRMFLVYFKPKYSSIQHCPQTRLG